MRLGLLFLLLVSLFSCADKTDGKHMLQGDAFGTTYSIQYYAAENLDLEKGIDSVINTVNRSVSTYMPDSDISKINKGDSTLVVDQIFIDVFLLSEKIHDQSDGYFDPTIGVLRNAYGFGDEKPLAVIDSITLDSLMNYVGFGKVRLNEKGTVTKLYPEIYFDFNAIAKGYGIDCLGRYLNKQGIQNYLIELGGELVAKGINSEAGNPWKVGVESVDSSVDDRTFRAVLELKDRAMASSGNYRKFRIDSLTGKKYVHTINPINGEAEQSDITSATVLAATCAQADAYATTFMAMGLERSRALLEKLSGIDAFFTYNNADNNEQVFITAGFQEALLD